MVHSGIIGCTSNACVNAVNNANTSFILFRNTIDYILCTNGNKYCKSVLLCACVYASEWVSSGSTIEDCLAVILIQSDMSLLLAAKKMFLGVKFQCLYSTPGWSQCFLLRCCDELSNKPHPLVDIPTVDGT